MSEIPRSFWREVPCGHPPDPIAMRVETCGGCTGAHWVCHCGWGLDPAEAVGHPPEAPGPIVPCAKCGCFVALPLLVSP
jgi:hypothetical protein